ncbi:MAG: flavin reductase family protein [Phycisphaerales bacterium JB039]
MEIDVASLDVASRYKLLIGCVTPRPIAFVSTVSPEGRPNLAPFSFFTAVGSNPMTLLFCPANKPDGSDKDTLRNAALREEGGTGEFVVNIASERYAKRVAAAAEPLAYGESEFELAGLTMAPSMKVRPARMAESPVAFECETTRIVRTNPGQPGGGNIVMGRVVHVFAAEGVLNERFHADPAVLQTIGRMGGLQYCTTRDRFEMPMGRAALNEE